MFHLKNYSILVNDEKWQPTREDIRHLLNDLLTNEWLESLAYQRLQKIVDIYNGPYSHENPDADAVVELMVYQARCGIEDIEQKKATQKELDEIARKKHERLNFIPGT
jgi:hypothetical protein